MCVCVCVCVCIYIYIYIYIYRHAAGRLGFRLMLSHIIDSNMVFDNSLLKTQHCKVRFKGKVGQSREKSSVLRYSSV